MSDTTKTLPEIGEAVLRRPALVKQDDEYDDCPAALFAFTAHGFDTDLTPYYTAAQVKSAMEAAWTASRQKALREGADYVLDLLVAAGHVTREKAFQARDIACTAGVLPPEESAAELARGDGTTP